jgi:hypothetical protein
MNLIDAADIAELRRLFVDVRDNRAHTGPFYRAGVPQPETTIRIERTSSYSAPDTESSEERRGDVVGVGAIDLDVQVDDTRVIDGSLYRVRYIHPDRRIVTQLDMEMVAAAWPDYIYLTDEDGVFVTDEYGTPIVGL